MYTLGLPRNLGGPPFSTESGYRRTGKPDSNFSWPAAGVSAGGGSETTDTEVVRACDDKGARPDGAAGVGTAHSTAQAGERARVDPVEGRGRRE